MSQGDLFGPDFEAAAKRREAGIASSSDHAEADEPGWGACCLALLYRYAPTQTEPWTIEDFRAWAYRQGLPRPEEQRAFGSVTQAAIRSGVIRRVGYAPAASSNGSPKPTYLLVGLTP